MSFAKPAGRSIEDQFLYTMNLTTAQTALVGAVGHFPNGILVIAAANVQTVPEPGTGFSAAGGILLAMSRRRKFLS